MTLLEHIKGLWGISLLTWGLLYIHSIYRIKKFIICRYEDETSLTKTAFFQNHVPFVKYLPDFFSAGFYGTHLSMCLWGWKVLGKKKIFNDIADPKTVVRHFSEKEIWKIKWGLICSIILLTHGITYYLLRYIWPGTFN